VKFGVTPVISENCFENGSDGIYLNY
jgi:hypothetical protein